MDKITIYQFTDPVCVWCWGNEPVMRAIDYLYGNNVGIEFIMGGLVEEISTLYDLQGPKSAVIERANKIMAENWLKASERHGMPVRVDRMALFSERYPSSFPQNIAYEAARRIDPEKAKVLLRRIREATFTEQRRTSQMDVLIELAVECGLDAAEFIDEYTAGGAQSDFMQSRMRCRRNGVTGFPSYMIRNENTKITLGGYQNLSTFHTTIARLSQGRIKPRRVGPSLASITEFIKRYGTVYPVEIEVAFALDRNKTDLMIAELVRSGKIAVATIGNGQRLSFVGRREGVRQVRRQRSAQQVEGKPQPMAEKSGQRTKREKIGS